MTTTAPRSPWPVFAIAAAGAFITTLDLSIVNVAFAEIAKTYSSASRADVAWVVTAYNIMFASLLVAAGRTADRLGRKRVFLMGTAVFGAGSIVCATAPNLALLVAGRVVQGLGGAFLTPASLGLLLGAFPQEKRTQVVALSGGIGALGVASGPTLGALLISQAGWRSAFWLNIPVIAVVLVAGIRVLVESPRETSRHRPDYLGAVMITASLAALALAISQSEIWGWTDSKTLAAIAVVAVVVPLFLRRQATHPEPVLDLTLFRERHFAVANMATTLFFVGFSAALLNNVLFLRTVWKYSVLEAGLASCLAPITVAFVSSRAGRLVAKLGFRPLLMVGPLLFSSALALDALLLTSTPRVWLWLLLGMLQGTGIGLTIPALSSTAVSTLPAVRFAVGGAINSTARQVGSVLGVAVLVAVQGRPKGLSAAMASFDRGWVLSISAGVACSLMCATQLSRTIGHATQPAAAPAVLAVGE